jgi:hypothetical protein
MPNITFLEFNIFVLIISLALSILYPYFLYKSESKLKKQTRNTLAIIRGIVVFIISFFLLSPLLNNRGLNYEKPIILFAQDNSKSILLNANKAFYEKEYIEQSKEFINELSSKYDVKTFSIAEELNTGNDINFKGNKSNLSLIFDEAINTYKNRNLAAIVLASDGISNTGRELSDYVQIMKSPVYTVLMGDSIPQKDIRIQNIIHNEIVYKKNDFIVDIRISAYDLANKTASISILKDGKTVYTSKEKISSKNESIAIKTKLNADVGGYQKYTVKIEPINSEKNINNNISNFYIEVIENKQKIALIAASAHPDLAAIKQSIEKNENYQVELLFADQVNINKLKDYQLLILHQLPTSFASGTEVFKYIQNNNTPAWLIVGNQTYIDLFNKLNFGIRVGNYKNNPNEVFPKISAEFQGFVLDERWNNFINELPPLQSPYGNYALDNASQKLFTQKIGSVSTDQALLVFNNAGSRKAILMGEGIWRWKIIENKLTNKSELIDDLCSKIIQYLSSKDDKRKFKVYLQNKNIEESDEILFRAELYNDSYEAINTPEVSLNIRNKNNKVYPFNFNRTEKQYELNIGSLPEGSYTYDANTTLSSNKYSASGKFNVIKLNLEELNTVADYDNLRNLSELTGAKAFKATELEKLKIELLNNENFKTLSYEENKTDELINLKWIFILLLTLFSFEWFVRKYLGVY